MIIILKINNLNVQMIDFLDNDKSVTFHLLDGKIEMILETETNYNSFKDQTNAILLNDGKIFIFIFLDYFLSQFYST